MALINSDNFNKHNHLWDYMETMADILIEAKRKMTPVELWDTHTWDEIKMHVHDIMVERIIESLDALDSYVRETTSLNCNCN